LRRHFGSLVTSDVLRRARAARCCYFQRLGCRKLSQNQICSPLSALDSCFSSDASQRVRRDLKSANASQGVASSNRQMVEQNTNIVKKMNAQCDVSQLGRAARVRAAVSADATPSPLDKPLRLGIATPQRNEGWERLRLPEWRFFEGAS
jgi:hypothetical protein